MLVASCASPFAAQVPEYPSPPDYHSQNLHDHRASAPRRRRHRKEPPVVAATAEKPAAVNHAAAAVDKPGTTVDKPVATADNPGTAGAPGSAKAPSDMIGFNQDQLIAALGPPQSKRDDPPGKTWRYQMGSCSVDFFFYPDVRTRQYRILHTEVKGHDPNQRNSDCGKNAAGAKRTMEQVGTSR